MPPGGMYGNFAGRDASRGMAKQSFDVGMYLPSCCFWKIVLIDVVEMLTDVDKPLDRLDDLKPDEMYVA